MIGLRAIAPERYRANLKKEIQDTCLITAVEKRCDEINDICECMRYVPHRYVQELLNEIIDLIRIQGGEN